MVRIETNRRVPQPMDRGIVYIIAGVVTVLMIVVGVEVGIDSTATTGIDLNRTTSFAPVEIPSNPK